MKYCSKCGSEIADEAVVCPKCGCATSAVKKSSSSVSALINVLSIINCVIVGLALIPLAWRVPMTVHYYRAAKEERGIGVGFKVCTILFGLEPLAWIAGILMFFDEATA